MAQLRGDGIRLPENFHADIWFLQFSEQKKTFRMYREDLIREKLAKNESKAALHRSHRCRRSMVISSSPSSCDSTGISTVPILALVAEIFCI